MARRRYLSTQTGLDRELSELDDFAALLFTWAIPHAEDDRSLPGAPDDLLFLVMPRRRDKTPADARGAIRAWVAHGLCDWGWTGGKQRIYLKAESFYRIQAYIGEVRRFTGLPDDWEPVEPEPAPPQDAPPSAQIGATQRTEAQNGASVSVSVSASPAPGAIAPSAGVPASAAPRRPTPRRSSSQPDQRVRPVIDHFAKRFAEEYDGDTYPVVGARDGDAIRRLPATYTAEALCELADLFFSTDDAWIRKASPHVAAFCSLVPKLVQLRASGGARASPSEGRGAWTPDKRAHWISVGIPEAEVDRRIAEAMARAGA